MSSCWNGWFNIFLLNSLSSADSNISDCLLEVFDSILKVYFCNTVTNLAQISAFLSLLTIECGSTECSRQSCIFVLKDDLSHWMKEQEKKRRQEIMSFARCQHLDIQLFNDFMRVIDDLWEMIKVFLGVLCNPDLKDSLFSPISLKFIKIIAISRLN